jgi:hypothetical protein
MNSTLKGTNGTFVENDATFYKTIRMRNQSGTNQPGFAWILEADGSMSLTTIG